MTKTYHVLIIEDEPMVIDNYLRALEYVQQQSDSIAFKADQAKTCQAAYEKINQAINERPYDLVFLDIR